MTSQLIQLKLLLTFNWNDDVPTFRQHNFVAYITANYHIHVVRVCIVGCSSSRVEKRLKTFFFWDFGKVYVQALRYIRRRAELVTLGALRCCKTRRLKQLEYERTIQNCLKSYVEAFTKITAGVYLNN